MPIEVGLGVRRRGLGAEYTMTQEDVGVVLDVVAGTLQLGLMQVYDLFDHKANHYFVACQIVNDLHVIK